MKAHLTLEGQLSLLVTNGLEVSDPDLFLIFLNQRNCYWLRGCFHPFLSEVNVKVANQFMPQSTDQAIIELVEFDRTLRSLLFEALAVFETQFRAVLAHHAGKTSPHAHFDGIELTTDFKTA
jgi:abortive infection bacteriophage resistance protein